MTGPANELDEQYRVALHEYLATPDEALLERAYGISRQALATGRGVLDMATMHARALAAAATRLPAEPAKEILAVRKLLDQIEDRIRRVSHELRPTILDDLGLVPAIEFLADGVSQRWGIPVTVQASIEGGVPPTIETVLYRAAQEGLNDVARHAQATQAQVTLHQSPRAITCSVRDDGKGFDVAMLRVREGGRGLGLVEIRERMAALGGTLRVGPAVDLGTEFKVDIPLEAPAWA